MKSLVWMAAAVAVAATGFALAGRPPDLASSAPPPAAPATQSEEAERGAGGPALRQAQGGLSVSKAASGEPGGVRPSTLARGALSSVEGQGAPPTEELEVPPPPFTDGIFPCSSCHADMPVDRTRRELGMHAEIELTHDEEHRWCLDCHNADDRDYLHLASGELVPFDESYRLCGQCHGEKYRDWRAGVHGRRAGDWNGHKTYLLCAHCHNPHQPRFAPMAPMPAPIPPAETVRRHGDR